MSYSAAVKTVLGIGLCVVLMAGTALAQDSAPVQCKVGVVNMGKVLKDYKKREAKYKELQAEVDRLQTDIDTMSKNIESMKEQYKNNGNAMSDDERKALKDKIEGAYDKYQSELKTRQRKVDGLEEAVLTEVVEDIKAAIERVATQKNYHIVLNSTEGPRGAVLYNVGNLDLTGAVLEALNAQPGQ